MPVELEFEFQVFLVRSGGKHPHADPGVGEILQRVPGKLHFDAGGGVQQRLVDLALDQAVLAGGGEEERVFEVDVVDLRLPERVGLLHEHDRDGAVD